MSASIVASNQARPSDSGPDLAGRLEAVESLQRCGDVLSPVGVGHDLQRVGVVGQVVLGEQLLALDGVELLRVGLLGRQPRRVEPEEAEARQQQQAGGHDPDQAWPRGDGPTHAGPHAGRCRLHAAEVGPAVHPGPVLDGDLEEHEHAEERGQSAEHRQQVADCLDESVLPDQHCPQAAGGQAADDVSDAQDDPGPVVVALRSEDPATADDQQRRQEDHHDQERDSDADGVDRAQARGGVEVGDGEAEHPDGHRRGAGEDRRRGAVQGDGHRLVAVVVAPQLFSVARDEQQGVVGPGADHQDAQDRLALGVHGQAGVLGEEVDQPGGDEVGHDRAADREQPQVGAAVGEEQQHDDHEQGDQDEVGVDALERCGRVGGLAAVAGEVDLAAVERRDVADLLGGVRDGVPALGAEVQDEVEVGHLAVLGGERRHRGTLGGSGLGGGRRQHALLGDPLDLCDLLAVGLHGGPVVVGQPTVTVVDDQGRDVVGVHRLRELVQDLGRLGRAGQPRRRLVVEDRAELGGEDHHHAGDHQRHGEDDPLGDAAGERSGDLSMHGPIRSGGTDIVHR